MIPLILRARHFPVPDVAVLRLAHRDALALPVAGAGASIGLQGPGGLPQRRYSLLACDDGWELAVRWDGASRGLARHLHRDLAVGGGIMAQPPGPGMQIDRRAPRVLAIAGGIGVTPFLSLGARARQQGVPFELHHIHRWAGDPPLGAALRRILGPDLHLHGPGLRPDLLSLLAGQPLGTRLMVCGPPPLMSACLAAAHQLGWPAHHVQTERFGPTQAGGSPFMVELPDGRRVDVGPDQTLLQVLLGHGLPISHMCGIGICGQCRIRVAAPPGGVDHRDQVLDDHERAAGDCMMACVSRPRGSWLRILSD